MNFNILDMHGDAADLNLSDLVGRAERYSAQDPGRTVHRVSFMLNGWFLIERRRRAIDDSRSSEWLHRVMKKEST
ncbi:hypothetical protein [Paenibacillus illinoisensis]|uniref:hypothetical protein n=1 Tax=Paenibacillus illinoisensis TaxID=59845 RepID=UPI00203BC12A|nr:hypothetical protein [Paenibacillus illinoisensis]MCM3206192.1 hypothetical protein [Paenibacillus illinoisensis]